VLLRWIVVEYNDKKTPTQTNLRDIKNLNLQTDKNQTLLFWQGKAASPSIQKSGKQQQQKFFLVKR